MQEINKEQLDLFIKLQPLFKEKIGEWPIDGDMYYRKDKEFPKGKIEYTQQAYSNSILCKNLPDNVLRIPVTIDLTCSERCLWGMVDWSKMYADFEFTETLKMVTGKIAIQADGHFIYNNPTTAILKALAEQENV